MGKVKVVVHGLGFIALNHHLPSLKRMDDVEISGVVSRNIEHAKKVARDYGARPYSSLEEAIEKEKPDIVVICTETFRHKGDALTSIEHGVNIFLEKPITLRLKDADDIINTAKKKGVKLMVGHVLRFWPEYVATKDMVDKGEIGNPVVARAYRYVSFPPWSFKRWHKDLEKSGGVFVDLSIHDVDFLRWVLGEVEEVFARGATVYEDTTAPVYMHALLKFKNGAIAYVDGSWLIPPTHPFYTYLEIAGTRGLLVVDNLTTAGLRVYLKDEVRCWTPVPRDGYYLELRSFINSVKKDLEPAITGEEARKSLEVTLAALKSFKENRPVKLPLEEEVI